jgi:hypothetical protein
VSLLSRIGWLERQFGTDDSPCRITIWFGPHLSESWIEWRGNDASFFVATPNRVDDPLEHLTPAQCHAKRPGDLTTVITIAANNRDAHLQYDRPPWKHNIGDGYECGSFVNRLIRARGTVWWVATCQTKRTR